MCKEGPNTELGEALDRVWREGSSSCAGPIFAHSRPLFDQNRPLFAQKRPLFAQAVPISAQTKPLFARLRGPSLPDCGAPLCPIAGPLFAH